MAQIKVFRSSRYVSEFSMPVQTGLNRIHDLRSQCECCALCWRALRRLNDWARIRATCTLDESPFGVPLPCAC